MWRTLFGRGRTDAGKTAAATPPATPAARARVQPLDVTDADFDQTVATSNLLAVVDFWADWCEPCRIMSAYVGFLAADFDGRVLVAALDVDENPAVAERYQILGLPTLLFLRQGTEIARIVGVLGYDDLKREVEQHLAANAEPAN